MNTRERMDDLRPPYFYWNPFRCNVIINHYGEDFFEGKTLLEVGTFTGSNGNTFAKLGATVTIQDAREDHVVEALERYPHLTGYVHDLNKGLGTDDHFDIILHMGVLYHLESLQPLIDACSQCNHLILETRVSRSTKMKCYTMKKSGRIEQPDQAFTKNLIRPTVSILESTLEEQGFIYERVHNLGNVKRFHYDWESIENNKEDPKFSPRALWFCKRKKHDTT